MVMPPSEEREEVAQQVEEIMHTWVEFDETVDPSVFDDVFAEDIVEITDGEPPIIGKESVKEFLTTLDPTPLEWEHDVQDLHVGRDLVVARVESTGTRRDPERDDIPEELVIGGLDIFRREEGGLKQIYSVPSANE